MKAVVAVLERGGEREGSGEGTLSKLLVSVYVTGSFVFTCG